MLLLKFKVILCSRDLKKIRWYLFMTNYFIRHCENEITVIIRYFPFVLFKLHYYIILHLLSASIIIRKDIASLSFSYCWSGCRIFQLLWINCISYYHYDRWFRKNELTVPTYMYILLIVWIYKITRLKPQDPEYFADIK